MLERYPRLRQASRAEAAGYAGAPYPAADRTADVQTLRALAGDAP